ncbi:MAG: DUF6808 domain-containing protein [Candidatus Limimorpha sp.]
MEKTKKIVLLLLLALLAVSVCFNVHLKSEGLYKNVERITFVDTIPYYKPIPKDSTVIRYVTHRLPVSDDMEDNFPNKSDPIIPETPTKKPNIVTNTQDSLRDFGKSVPDSADVLIPITQKIYKDSTYTAWVSGYNPSLDSLIFRMHREVITVKEYQKPKRMSIGVQVGYGMTLKGTPQFAPYVGIGVSYNLFSF